MRPLIYMLARRAGMPEKVLDAYMRFQEGLATYNTVVGGLGDPYGKMCGLPQGDPLSMMMVAILMRTWVVLMKEEGVMPSLLVDDIMVVAEGIDMLRKFSRAMDTTHQYRQDMGGVSSPPFSR